MKCGYEVQIDENSIDELRKKLAFKRLYKVRPECMQSKNIRQRLVIDNFLTPNGELDAEKIENLYFPVLEADVFISHAHADEDIALGLQEMLWEKFGVSSFVDSLVWNSCDELLSEIDKRFSRSMSRSNCFDYKATRRSASRIYMILSAALIKTIQACDCMFFIQSENFMCGESYHKRTHSPWIYLEQVAFDVMTKTRWQPLNEEMVRKASKLNVVYTLLSGLPQLTEDDFIKWKADTSDYSDNPLEVLYDLKRIL